MAKRRAQRPAPIAYRQLEQAIEAADIRRQAIRREVRQRLFRLCGFSRWRAKRLARN